MNSSAVGRWSLAVVGSAQTGDAISSHQQAQMIAWAGANYDVSRLESAFPRLPFVLASALSEEASAGLARALGELGFVVERRAGGALSYPAMRTKMWRAAAHRTWVMVLNLALGIHFFRRLGLVIVALVVGLIVGLFVHAAWRAGRRCLLYTSDAADE